MNENILSYRDHSDTPDEIREFISFVVPAYNEEDVLHQFYTELTQFLENHNFANCEIIFVDDGSTDRSQIILKELVRLDPRVRAVCLSRNFGKEIALAAGLDHSSGDCAVLIDADLQHPFPIILQFVKFWRAGFDVVYGVQKVRQQDWIRRRLASAFHFLFSRLSDSSIEEHAGDYRLLSRRAVNCLNSMREKHRVMKGLYSCIGLPQKAVYFSANNRRAGATKLSLFKLFLLSIESITCVTTAPLRLATIFGLITAGLAITSAFFIVVQTLIYGNPVAGFPTLITVMLFLGGVQLLSLGIIGEYLGRVFNETKQRPLYFVEEVLASRSPTNEKKAA